MKASPKDQAALVYLSFIYTLDILKLCFAVQLGLHVRVVKDALAKPPFIKQRPYAGYDQKGNCKRPDCAP